MWKLIVTALVALVLGAAGGVFAWTRAVPLPNDAIIRAQVFEMEDSDWLFQNASEVFPTRRVARSEFGTPLPRREGALEGFSYQVDGAAKTLDNMFTDMETSGLMIVHGGEVLFEEYARGAQAGTSFTTYSLVKSITSTLIGAAIAQGHIDSVEDPLAKYIPEITGTAYDGVTIRQALEMSSGVEWDPGLFEGGGMPDTLRLITRSVATGEKRALDLVLAAPRAAEPGTVFNYNTGESQVLIEVVRRATGRDAADYLQETIWQPLGMAHDAAWILDRPGPDGAEIGGAFFNAPLVDWARFGQFILQDGVWNGQRILPEGWVAQATASDLPHLSPEGTRHPGGNRGYAWHWWTVGNGIFVASGANGQSIFVDPAHDLVIARSSAWPEGWVREHDAHTQAMIAALGPWLTRAASATEPVMEGE